MGGARSDGVPTEAVVPNRGDGTPIMIRHWRGGTDESPMIWGFHGFSEYGGRYRSTAEFFARKGYPFVIADFRGHGDSGGPRASVQSFDEYVTDIETAWEAIETRFPDRPVFVVAHSMGALNFTLWIMKRGLPSRVRGVFMSAPLFGISGTLVRWLSEPICALIQKWRPSFYFSLYHGMAYELTHDLVYLAERYHDPKVNRIVTVAWIMAMHEASRRARMAPPYIPVPLLVAQAGTDRVVSNVDSQEFFDRVVAPKKKIINYPGLFHEIMNEVQRDTVRGDILNWMRECGV